MKRVEVKLSLSVVAPLLDVVREMAADLGQAPSVGVFPHGDEDLGEAWTGDLVRSQESDTAVLLALFGEEFFSEGVIHLDARNVEAVARACSALRLRLRERHLKAVSDELLESGEVDAEVLDDGARKGFLCYLFLAAIQEIIIRHLDGSIIGS
jgi:hypothetical protein